MWRKKLTSFLFDSVYQVVALVWVALSISALFYYAERNSARGVRISLASLLCSVIVVIVFLARQHFAGKHVDSVNRPELFVEEVTPGLLQVGKPNVINLVFRNRGNSTAYNIAIESHHFHTPSFFQGPLTYQTVDPNINPGIGPNATSNVASVSPWVNTADEIAEIKSGTRIVFCYGRGTYEDGAGNEYPIKFCYQYNAFLERMVICPQRFWPKEAESGKKIKATRDKRAWMNVQAIYMSNFEVGPACTVSVSAMNGGDIPAILKNIKIDIAIKAEPMSFSEPMTLKDVDDSGVVKPSQPFPTSTVTPGEHIMIPINYGPMTALRLQALKDKAVYLHVLGAIEYVSSGRGSVPCYNVFCAVYDVDSGFFAVCGGGTA